MKPCGHRAFLLLAALLAARLAPGAGAPASAPAAKPNQIVSLAPHATEILFAIGAGDKVVGVGDSSLWPEEATKLPRLGGVMEPKIDQIVSLKPDLVILTPSHFLHPRPLKNQGVKTLTLATDSIKDALNAMRDLAVMTGCEEKASRIVGPMVEELNTLGAEAKGRTPSRALVCIYHDGSMDRLLALAPNNYLNEILGLAGGENVIALKKDEIGIAYPISPQDPREAREAKPEIVIDLLAAAPASPSDALAVEAKWKEIFGPAASPRRIYAIYDPYLPVPGIRIPESIRKLRGMLFPAAP